MLAGATQDSSPSITIMSEYEGADAARLMAAPWTRPPGAGSGLP
ncbi:Uncharacterised protein [Bordetella pertussis]|nr:Uncharacterised protein [Bordetella pertussis]